MEEKNKLPNCRKCKYFVVSLASSFPYTCTFFGFKQANLIKTPAQTVFETTGHQCFSFEVNPKLK